MTHPLITAEIEARAAKVEFQRGADGAVTGLRLLDRDGAEVAHWTGADAARALVEARARVVR